MSLDPRADAFRTLKPGSRVSDAEGELYTVTHQLSASTVLARSEATGRPKKLDADAVRLLAHELISTPPAMTQLQACNAARAPTQPDLLDYSQAEWEEAQRRLDIIRPIVDGSVSGVEEIKRLAGDNGVSVTTFYRWVKLFRASSGRLSALVPAKRGPKEGSVQLGESVEAIIAAQIEEWYLDSQRHKIQEVADKIRSQCRLAGLVPPHADTVRRRIHAIAPAVRARRRGQREISEKYLPQRGTFPNADFPLAVVQIDHTPADILVVDSASRKPLGRPFLTVAIDVYSRMIVGLHLSLEPPSATSVGICLAQAMTPKREYLAKLNVKGEWPVWGRISTIHCDNAKEFRGQVLERACQEYGISIEWRPAATPHYGGHVERVIGTLMREMHKLPGTTFSNPRQRKGYDSAGKAALTLKELEQVMVEFIVNVYHQRRHSVIGMPPIRKWTAGITGEDGSRPAAGLLPIPADPERLLLDFLPFVERTVQPYGLVIDHINYYDPVLDPHIHAMNAEEGRKKRFTVRRDPRDISRIYWFDEDVGSYVTIPYRNSAHPPISLFQLREAQRRIKAEGRKDIDEDFIFETVEHMNRIVAKAVENTAKARRHVARSARSAAPASLTEDRSGDAPAISHGATPLGVFPTLAPFRQHRPAETSELASPSDDSAQPLVIDDDIGSRAPAVIEDIDFNS